MPTNKELEKQVNETDEKIEKISGDIEKLLKLVAPVVIRKETDGEFAGEDHVREVSIKDGDAVIETPKNANPDSIEFKEKADELAFMNEKVGIHVHEVSEEDADPRFLISVNNNKFYLTRGEDVTVPRFIVALLATARKTGYKNEEFVKEDGVRDVRWPAKTGVRYPFSVMEDSERGRHWLKRLRVA